MADAFRFRTAGADDRDAFLDMSREFYASDAVLHDVDPAFHEKAFAELLRSGTYLTCYIFTCGNQTAGYALQLPFESCRADLKIVAVRHGVLFIEDRIERAGNGLAVGDIHAAVLVDVQPQEPLSALADIFHVPERTAVRLHDRLGELRHLFGNLQEKTPLPARKSGETFPTLK